MIYNKEYRYIEHKVSGVKGVLYEQEAEVGDRCRVDNH